LAIIDLNWMMWNGSAKVVGWPLPKAGTGQYAYQRIAAAAPEYRAAGFDAALFQPATLGAAGEYSGGYDKKDDYTFEPTSWGSKAQCQEAVDALHDSGLRVYGDLVLHQMDGYPKQQYTTKQFPKTPDCFAWDSSMGTPKYPGNVSPDSVPDPAGGWPDGDLCAYDQPGRYMWNGAINAALNQMLELGFDDFRIDEAKDLHAPFLCALIDAIRSKYPGAQFFGEYFDGNPYALGGWVNYWMQRRASVLDLMFKFNVSDICNNNSNRNMGRLSEIGYNMRDAIRSLTFLESADTDTSIGEQLIWNKQLGIAIQHTFPGEPMTYYRDWATDKNCYGLKECINNALWIHKNLAQGDFVTRHADYQTFAHERMGYGNAPGCVVLLNNDQWNEHTITVQTRYGNNVRLHEFSGITGYNADKWTDYSGRITVTIPRNVNGLSSLVYAPYL
jgi:alpha-amylase